MEDRTDRIILLAFKVAAVVLATPIIAMVLSAIFLMLAFIFTHQEVVH